MAADAALRRVHGRVELWDHAAADGSVLGERLHVVRVEDRLNRAREGVDVVLRKHESSLRHRQRVLLNTEPIFERLQSTLLLKGVTDVREDSEGWCYCYLYGLLIHKLGHYHDIVHGTRHDFYMNELRIEYMESWIALLEKKGLDPAAIETSVLTRRMVKQLAPGQTVN